MTIRELLPNKNPLNYLVVGFTLYHFLLNSIGTISLSDDNQWNTLLIWFGTPILFGLSLNEFIKRKTEIPAESKQIVFFMLYVILGYFYCIDTDYFLVQYRKLFLYMLVFLIVQYTISQTGNVKLVFISLLLGSAYTVIYSLFLVPEELGGGFNAEEGFRVTGGYINLNGLSNYSISGFIAVLFLYKNMSRPYNLIVLGFIPLFLLSIIASASKTGLLSFMSTMGLWYIFCLRSATGKNSASAVLTLAGGLIAANFLLDFVIEKTYLGERFTALSDINEYYEKDGRGQLANTAIDVFFDNPLFGVGLGQFRYYNSRAAYTHSEYLEIITGFGFLGALIYFPYYFFIWRRLRQASTYKFAPKDVTEYNINFMKVILISMLLRGISVIIIYSIDELIYVGLAGAYSYYILNHLKQQNKHERLLEAA